MKLLQPNEQIVKSLLALQDELVSQQKEDRNRLSTDELAILYKINSCLFSEYPHNRNKR